MSSKQLFSVTNELLGKPKCTPLSSKIPRSDLPQRFCDFFWHKIKRIHLVLDSLVFEPPAFAVYNRDVLAQFEPVSK